MSKQKIIEKQPEETFTPICGGNYTTPVIKRTDYLDEVHYTIGGRLYIENAD